MLAEDEMVAARIEIEIRVANLDHEEPDIRVCHPLCLTMQIPPEFRKQPQVWLKLMTQVVPLMHEVQNIVGVAINQEMTKDSPRRH